MHARAIDDASVRLRELRREEWEQLGVGALALGLAVAATQVRPALALPLFFGGLAVGALGLRALWRRWDLVDRLSGEREAYVIAEVLAHAMRETTMERRHGFAEVIRERLDSPVATRLRPAVAELAALASELDDAALELDPACAVACLRLVDDVAGTPAVGGMRPPEELRARARRIRSGFTATSSSP